MRIGIDARFFGPRVGGGGLGRYVAELVQALARLDRTNHYVVFLKKDNFADFVPPAPNWEKRLVDVHWYTAAEQLVMPREIALAKVDIMHFPHWNVPLRCPVPFVVTIHDLILLEDPKSARATTRGPLVHAVKTVGFRLVLNNAVKKARHVIAVSEATKRAIIDHLHVPAKKISVVHNGMLQLPDSSHVSLRDLGVVDPYILAVGNAYPHKNLPVALEAFAAIADRHPDLTFVLAGRHDMFVDRLLEEAAELGLEEGRFRTVALPHDDELAALYRHAKMLVFPSRIEGFGWPPLEAMLAETPVLASDIPPHQELLGGHATLLPTDDAGRWAKAMERTLTAPPSAEERLRARHHVLRYSWDNAARQVQEVYVTFGGKKL